MRLRDVIRQPDRYNTEVYYTPASKRTRTPQPPSYIDFDPTLPPAAFPTLDKPRVSNDKEKINGRGSDETRTSSSFSSGNGILGDAGQDERIRVDLEEIPIAGVENRGASNGDLNQVYVSNMTMMANSAVLPSAFERDMEDSDPDVVMADNDEAEVGKSPGTGHDPNWCDLSQAIQVEIFENLLELYNWKTVAHMLRLTVDEQDKLQEHFGSREKQVELEDRQLERMRAKQLRALMRVDNSDRVKGAPPKLVFRQTSKHSVRKLREDIPKDYFACRSEEVTTARRFLLKRDLHPSWIGDWSNSLADPEEDENDTDSETVGLLQDYKQEEQGELPPRSIIPAPFASLSGSRQPKLSLLSQQLLIHAARKIGTVAPRHLHRKEHQYTPSRRPSNPGNNPSPPSNQHSGIVRLKVGSERAAKIGDLEHSAATPRELVRVSPAVDSLYETPSQSNGNLHGSSSVELSPSLPSISPSLGRARTRTLASFPSHSPAERPSRFLLATSSRMLRQRLEEVRLEAEQARADQDINRDSSTTAHPTATDLQPNQDSDRSLIVPSSIELTPPSRIMHQSHLDSEDSSDAEESSIRPFRRTDRVRPGSIIGTPTSYLVTYDSDELSSSPIVNIASLFLDDDAETVTAAADTMDTDDDWCTEDEEAEGEEDEMVLVPAHGTWHGHDIDRGN